MRQFQNCCSTRGGGGWDRPTGATGIRSIWGLRCAATPATPLVLKRPPAIFEVATPNPLAVSTAPIVTEASTGWEG